MLIEQTIEKLTGMRLLGMAKALRQWCDSPKNAHLAPEDLVGILADSEWVARENAKLTQRLRTAKFKEPSACVEDINYHYPRGLAKTTINELSSSRWVATHRNVVLTGPTGVGKSYMACALGNKACRDGYSVLFRRASRFYDELGQSRADGTLPLLLKRLSKVDVLIIDDFCSHSLNGQERRHLVEVLEDRYGVSSTIVTSQLDPAQWHSVIGDETVADGVCDRLVHNAYRIKLIGESVRKLKEKNIGLTVEISSTKYLPRTAQRRFAPMATIIRNGWQPSIGKGGNLGGGTSGNHRRNTHILEHIGKSLRRRFRIIMIRTVVYVISDFFHFGFWLENRWRGTQTFSGSQRTYG